jgi:hypothetical protein
MGSIEMWSMDSSIHTETEQCVVINQGPGEAGRLSFSAPPAGEAVCGPPALLLTGSGHGLT